MRNPSVEPKQSTARLGSSAKRAYVINRASITVFPVTEMFSGLIPSRSKYPRGFRGSEMEIRKVGRDAAIDLFGEGIILLLRAQACFDVPNRNVVVVRRERGGKRSGYMPCTSTKSGRSSRRTRSSPFRQAVVTSARPCRAFITPIS